MRLEVTRKTDLAVQALRLLGDAGTRLKGTDLATAIGSTPGFVSQVMTPLVRLGWVRSEPGPSGGYVLAVDLEALSVLDVVEAIEGKTDSGACVLADRPCDELDACALHFAWVRARQHLLTELAGTSIAPPSPEVPAARVGSHR